MSEETTTTSPASSGGTPAPTSSAGQAAPSGSTAQSAAAKTTGTETAVVAGASGDATQTTPAFTPNYKFKVMEKEHEIDEMFRPLIKDADSEKKIKELMEKAYGIDYFKPRHEKLREEHQTIKGEYQNLTSSIQQLSHMVQKGDLGGFFDAIKVPRQDIYKWVLNEVNKMEMPPEQRRALEQQEAIQKENYLQQNALQSLQANWEQTQVQLREMQVGQVFAQPEVRAVQQAYDARVGQPGAFKRLVVERGLLAWNTQGKDIPPEQAVQEAMQIVGNVMPEQQSQPQVMAQPTPPPVIPNVSSSGGSPARKRLNSLDALKKHAASLPG